MALHPTLVAAEGRVGEEEGEATLFITCCWPSGVRVELECLIRPAPNVLVVRWRIANWNTETQTGHSVPPVWFSLYRWADPTIEAFAARFLGDYRHDTFKGVCGPRVTPLPPPSIRNQDGEPVECARDEYGRATFPTQAGGRYRVEPAETPSN